MKTVLAFPISDASKGSSRIRCYEFLRYLSNDYKTHTCRLDEKYHRFPYSWMPVSWLFSQLDAKQIDLIYIQKAAYNYHRTITTFANRQGIPVIYDIDDVHGAWEGMDEMWMLDHCSAITVDTQERATKLRHSTKTPIHYVPSGLDYFDHLSPLTIKNKLSNMSSIVTFGWDFNCKHAQLFMDTLPTTIQKHYISNAPIIDEYTFHPWSFESFIPTLSTFDYCLLAQGDSNDAQQKSNNRLLEAIAAGLPTIVSNTPAYRKLYQVLGFENLIAETPSDAIRILDYLSSNPKIRQTIITKGRDYVLTTYHPKQSARIMEELFNHVLSL